MTKKYFFQIGDNTAIINRKCIRVPGAEGVIK